MQRSGQFRVMKEADEIKIFGRVSETSNLKILNELLVSDKTNILSWAKVEGASWNGLIELVKFLKASNKTYQFRAVPYAIYRSLKLFPDLNPHITLSEYQIPTFKADLTPEYQLVSGDEFFGSLPKNELFIELENSRFVQGFGSYYTGSESKDGIKSEWIRDHVDEFFFWFNYLNFCDSTLFLCQDLLQTNSIAIHNFVGELRINAIGFEKTCTILKPDHGIEPVEAKFIAFQNSCGEKVGRLIDGIGRFVEGSAAQLRRIQKEAALESGHNQKSLYDRLGDYSQMVQSVRDILKEVENTGETIGEFIMSTMVLGQYRKVFNEIEEVPPEKLAEVRELLAIMDPASEDSWPDTRELVLESLTDLEKASDGLAVVIQGFDLLRQVLEHRLKEIDLIKGYLAQNPGSDWQSLKADVFKNIAKTLVTDQEKYSCAFYVGEAADEKKNEECSAPGDVLLF